MKRFLTCLLIPLSILLVLGVLEGVSYFIPMPPDGSGTGNTMDPWGMYLHSCIRDQKLGYRLKPGAQYGKLSINSFGYVGKDFVQEKDINNFRIVCVGGSTTFCTDISSNEYSWPALLERAFAETQCTMSKKVEVINAGVPGYHTWHTRLRLDELEKLNPDLYIFMDGFNDVNASVAIKDSDLESLGKDSLLTALVGDNNSFPSKVQALAKNSRAYRIARKYALRLHEKSPLLGLDLKISMFNTENNQRQYLRYLLEKGRRVVLLDHPWSVQETDPSESNSQYLHLIPGMVIPDKTAIQVYMWGRKYVHSLNNKLSEELGIPLIDPQNAIDQATKLKTKLYTVFFRDAVHLTEYGNSILATEVYKNLLALPDIRHAVGLSDSCALESKARATPVVSQGETDWGSGWLKPFQTDVHVSSPVLDNITDATEVDGWGVYRPLDISRPARVSFGIITQPGRERLLFIMPRIARDAGSVQVYLNAGGSQRKIFELKDFPGTDPWTPIANRYVVDLSDVAEPDYILDFVLTGKYAQLWHDKKGNSLFFR